MSTIVEATVPAGQFALPDALSESEVEFRAVRLVAHDSDQVIPFLWASCDDRERLYDAVENDPSVTLLDALAASDGECLLRVEWDSQVHRLASIIRGEDAVILDMTGRDGVWHLQVLFSDHDLVATTYEVCEAHGIDLTVRRVDELAEAAEYGYFGLTERQYETVRRAYERGYYDVPRTATLEDLAEEFDVSHQALSERLRRAHETVITNALYHTIHRRDSSVSPRAHTGVDI